MTDDAKLLAEIDDRCTTYWAGGDCKLWSDVHLLARARDRIAALERQLAEARPIPREPTEARIEQMETALMNAEDSILGVANAIRRCLSQNADTDIKDARSAGAPDIPNIETDPSLLSRLRDAAIAQPEGEKK